MRLQPGRSAAGGRHGELPPDLLSQQLERTGIVVHVEHFRGSGGSLTHSALTSAYASRDSNRLLTLQGVVDGFPECPQVDRLAEHQIDAARLIPQGAHEIAEPGEQNNWCLE